MYQQWNRQQIPKNTPYGNTNLVERRETICFSFKLANYGGRKNLNSIPNSFVKVIITNDKIQNQYS